MAERFERNKEIYMHYVCPNCFNTLDKCDCESYPPYELIWVDKGIQEHVRILNNKGYHTRFCCESHSKTDNIYISFAMDYGIGDNIPVPDGFKLMKKSTISFLYNQKITDEEFDTQKKEQLSCLLDWCKNLPSLNHSYM